MRTLITHIAGVAHALTDVSDLVSTLANGYAYVDHDSTHQPSRDLTGLAEQALELASPVLDYEAAARDLDTWFEEDGVWVHEDDANRRYGNARALIEGEGFDPYEREVFEHWAVTAFIADRLEAICERIDRDFAGLIVWARAAQPDGSKPDISQCSTFRRMRLGS